MFSSLLRAEYDVPFLFSPEARHCYFTYLSSPGTFQLMWQGPSLDKQPVAASACPNAWGRFLTNEGNPPDLYLKLTSEARDMINGKIPVPPEPSVAAAR